MMASVHPAAPGGAANLLDRLRRVTADSRENQWERPGPTREELRRDVVGVLLFALGGAVALELTRGFGMSAGIDEHPVWFQHLVLAVMILPLVLRRKYPVLVMLTMSALFIALSLVSPLVSLQLSYQIAYFASLYSAVAWAKDRRMLWLTTAVVVVAMTLWIILALTVANTFDAILAQTEGNEDFGGGILEPLTSVALYNFLVNFAYFGGAILAGITSWRGALQRSQLAEQAQQISQQAEELARRAVIEERLRIARELHDVVAHHVSVIGVQAGAARRVIDKRPEVAVESLRTIEQSSRQAVTDMRNLLGVLRSEDQRDPGTGSSGQGPEAEGSARRPEPGLDDLEGLARQHQASGLNVTFGRVEDTPGALAEISAPLALSIFRTAQESLTNVRRHSTASVAVMTLRTGLNQAQRWVELETVDNGIPRPSANPGSGFGLQGIRERVALHRGTVEIGPRSEGGWRVRARFLLH